jgi:hypothetical protein
VNLLRVGSLLEDLTEIRVLTLRARRLLDLQRRVRALLPAPLSACTAVASLTDGRLLLVTENGVAAGKLRHYVPQLLRSLARCDPDVTAIHVRVQVTKRVNSLPQKQKSVHPEGRAALQALAGRLPPSPLRCALWRLSGAQVPRQEKEQEPFEDQREKARTDLGGPQTKPQRAVPKARR